MVHFTANKSNISKCLVSKKMSRQSETVLTVLFVCTVYYNLDNLY